MKIYTLFASLFFGIFFGACSSSNSDSNTDSQSDSTAATEILSENTSGNGGNWYKHFTGTIGDDINVTLNLNSNNNSLTGTYFYHTVGSLLNISGIIEENGKFNLQETNAKGDVTGEFNGTITGSEIVGTWTNADKSKQMEFKAAENYTEAIQFTAYRTEKEQKMAVETVSEETPAAKFLMHILLPSENNTKARTAWTTLFYNSAANSSNEVEGYMQKEMENYFAEYTAMGGEYDVEMGDLMYNWEREENDFIVFNDKNIVCLENFYYEFSGGAHGNYGASLFVYDAQNAKFLKLEDIFKTGYETTLSKAITESAKKLYDIAPNGSLTEAGIYDETIQPNENFYIDYKGITFVYNPYEIGPYAMGEARVYVSFKNLKDILKPNSPLSGFIK